MSDYGEDQARLIAVELFGAGTLVEERDRGFIVSRPAPAPSDGPEAMAPPAREIIGTGQTRREALARAERATATPRS